MTPTGEKVIVSDNGMISLPAQIRSKAGFAPGDTLWVLSSPSGTILMRKLSDIAADDEAFRAEMQEFRQALRLAGYETHEDIIKLVKEVKAEQAEEWFAG